MKKIFRLRESDIGKVLKRRNGTFSSGWIANVLSNRIGHNRFAVFFSGKHTKTSVSRNFFRRRFYSLAKYYESKGSLDIVFVPKKGKTFDKAKNDDIVAFENDIKYLLRTIEKTGGVSKPKI